MYGISHMWNQQGASSVHPVVGRVKSVEIILWSDHDEQVRKVQNRGVGKTEEFWEMIWICCVNWTSGMFFDSWKFRFVPFLKSLDTYHLEVCECQKRLDLWTGPSTLIPSRQPEIHTSSLSEVALVFLSASGFVTDFPECTLLKETERCRQGGLVLNMNKHSEKRQV